MKLLIDGDWLCYSIACAIQTENPFVPGEVLFDFHVAKTVIDNSIDKFINRLEATSVEVHFSCNRTDNWRRDLVPSYKMNREGKVAPVGLKHLIEYVITTYPTFSEGRLEADDTIGIASTEQKNTCIVSIDKDFLTVPTFIYNPKKDVVKKQNKVNAFKSFIYQVIIGDSSDGFKGIKGAGPKAALKFIAEQSKTLHNIWEPLVELAEKKGHDEEYLLTQARMAHILQKGDYDFKTKQFNLWTPDNIKGMLV